ncbi:MAG TPA: hypothetical protein V6D08_18055 [Candidatus Obscuribacterales bacterium]
MRSLKAPHIDAGRRAILALALMALGLASAQPAEARLGEDFAKYKTRVAKGFIATGEKKSGATVNYMFQLVVDQKQQLASPGYAAGITITAQNGKITGQSMAIRPGTNPFVGGTLAAIHGFAFAYEALGKPLPTDKLKAEMQFKAFSGAVTQAFMGNPQNLRYPGFPGMITLTRDPSGNLIVAARMEQATGTTQQPSPPQPPAARKPTG